jgi:hypothetical protein
LGIALLFEIEDSFLLFLDELLDGCLPPNLQLLQLTDFGLEDFLLFDESLLLVL